MHNLHPDEDSIIYLLISGIPSRSLKKTAASLRFNSVDHFLDSMHQITSVSADQDRRSLPSHKPLQSKESAGKFSSKDNQPNSKENGKDKFCVYCKNRGHLHANCFWRGKLKRKEQAAIASSSASSSSVAVSSVKMSNPSTSVAFVLPPSIRHIRFVTGRPVTVYIYIYTYLVSCRFLSNKLLLSNQSIKRWVSFLFRLRQVLHQVHFSPNHVNVPYV